MRGKGKESFQIKDKTGLIHLSQDVSQVDPYNELSQVHTYGYTFAHFKQSETLARSAALIAWGSSPFAK